MFTDTFYLQITQKQAKPRRSNGHWPTHKVGCRGSPETVLVGSSAAGLFVELYLDGWW